MLVLSSQPAFLQCWARDCKLKQSLFSPQVGFGQCSVISTENKLDQEDILFASTNFNVQNQPQNPLQSCLMQYPHTQWPTSLTATIMTAPVVLAHLLN